MGQASERNFRNELVVAVVALVMLTVTIVLAFLLAEGSRPEAAATATTHSMSPTEVSANLTPTLTNTQVPVTPRPTATPTVTNTTRASSTPEPTATSTVTVTAKDDDMAEETTPSATPTVQATRTPRSTATDTATSPPSRTPTKRPTRTTLPSLTPTTAPSPSSTPTTPTKTTTPTTLPASSTQAAEATIALVTPQTPTGQTCEPPSDWIPYTIRSGDNLFRISLRSNVPLTEMQEKNCIADPTRLEVGQVIYIPAYAADTPPEDGTPSATHSPTPVNGESDLPVRWGCSLPHVQITAPPAGSIQPLNAPFQVSGVATLPDINNFDFYKVELRRENEVLFRNLVESSIPAANPSPLTIINPADFGAGHYQIILTVVDNTGNYPEPCAVRVTFR